MGGLCMEKNSLFEIQFPLSRTLLGNYRTPHGGLANSTALCNAEKSPIDNLFLVVKATSEKRPFSSTSAMTAL